MLRSVGLSSILLFGLAAGLFGQHQMGHAAPKAATAPGTPGSGKNKRTIVDNWSRMTPEEREKALSRLPPERRKKIEDQLNQYNSLSPAERRDLRSRYAGFNQLPPEKQNQARRVYQQFGRLQPDRRGSVQSEFENLRSMPEAERNARLNSDEFRNKYTAGEQGILRNFSGLITPAK
jgi:predicted Fe-S protein YdhL (DUF1289 family)